MTFKELYANAKEQPRPETPATAFVKEIAAVTQRSELTVRRWLGEGGSSAEPDALIKSVLARHFNTTPEELFPKN